MGFDKKDITFPTFRQKEIIYESLKKVTSYSKVRISYLRKIDIVIKNNSNKLNENKVIMPVKIEPLSIVNYANYIFEKIDPLHRKLSDDELLSTHKKKFMEKNYKFNDLEFLLYIDDLPEAEMYDFKFWQSKVQVFYPRNEIIRNYLFAAKYDAKNKKLIAPLGFLNSTKGLKGLFLFVIDLTGKLYISVLCKPKVQHSSFKSGDDIISAGYIEILDGKITTIKNSSGHYQPRLSHLIYAINSFNELEIFYINAKVIEYNENNKLYESHPINEWLNKKIEILEKLSRAGLLHERALLL